jgi:predicted type IV restriction endonuclease
MANEISLRLNNTLRRCDTVVYDDFMRPLMIVEYKASHIPVTQRVFDQIARYNMVLGARYLIVSNGLTHYCCHISNGRVTFLRNIPTYASIRTPL